MSDSSESRPHLWLRTETKAGETRTPLTPQGTRSLLDGGFQITVETMKARVFSDEEYQDAGCQIVPAGTWVQAPKRAWILGLKELPEAPTPLSHTHIYFAHAFKGQTGAEIILNRFLRGQGNLLDLEYLVGKDGRRAAAFGYWAGYVGAALSLMAWASTSTSEAMRHLHPYESQQALDDRIRTQLASTTKRGISHPRGIVIGALGRSGRGASDCLENHGIAVTRWDIEETANGGPFPEILQHEILLNCILLSGPTIPWLSLDDLTGTPPLKIIADVSCDPKHPDNPLPVYDRHSSLEHPMLPIAGTTTQVISIDNLPSLLPRESSEDFAAQLLPHLMALRDHSEPWERCRATFEQMIATIQ